MAMTISLKSQEKKRQGNKAERNQNKIQLSHVLAEVPLHNYTLKVHLTNAWTKLPEWQHKLSTKQSLSGLEHFQSVLEL